MYNIVFFKALNEVATWQYHHQPFMATISGCNVLFPLKPTPSATHNPFLTASSLLSLKENRDALGRGNAPTSYNYMLRDAHELH